MATWTVTDGTPATGSVVSTATLAKPAGAAVGDLLFAVIAVRESSGTATGITTPAGWNLIAPMLKDAVNKCAMAYYYRIVDGSEGASQDFAIEGAASNYAGQMILVHCDLGIAATPVNVHDETTDPTGVSSHNTPTIDTLVDECLAFACFGMDGANAFGADSFSQPAGWTIDTQTQEAGQKITLGIFNKVVSPAGSVSATSTTGQSAAGSENYIVAFAPGDGATSFSDTPTGTVTFEGSSVEADKHSDGETGGLSLSGSVAEEESYADLASGTVQISGGIVESHSTLTDAIRALPTLFATYPEETLYPGVASFPAGDMVPSGDGSLTFTSVDPNTLFNVFPGVAIYPGAAVYPAGDLDPVVSGDIVLTPITP